MSDAERIAREMQRELRSATRGVNLPRGLVEQWIDRLEKIDALLGLAGTPVPHVTTYTTGTSAGPFTRPLAAGGGETRWT